MPRRRFRRLCRTAGLAALALAVAACTGRPGGAGWGERATLAPGWSRIGTAALDAATDPFTWVPAAGALALQIGDADNELADWANRETPVFGSRSTAADASDWLRAAALGSYVAAGLAAPTGSGGMAARAQGFAVGAGAIAATWAASEGLKQVAGRERPLGQDDRSFPSRHASLAAVGARLTHETLAYSEMPRGARIASDVGLAGLTLATGWARVEAGEHHPADVLAGAALGNFLAVFATRAFLDPEPGGVALRVDPTGDGWMLSAAFAF